MAIETIGSGSYLETLNVVVSCVSDRKKTVVEVWSTEGVDVYWVVVAVVTVQTQFQILSSVIFNHTTHIACANATVTLHRPIRDCMHLHYTRRPYTQLEVQRAKRHFNTPILENKT